MFGEINRRFNKAKKNAEENRFIVESTLDVEEVLPGSEDEFDDEIDVDSVPEDIYKEIDKKLDELISKGDYDDEEIEEMVDEDDDFDDDDFDIKVEEVVNEAIDRWVMNEENSYGSGEKVDVQNKTDDEKDGDHTETEIPEPDCPVKAEKEVEKGEELYDFSDDNKKPSDYKEGDQVKTEEADFETTEEAKKAMSVTNENFNFNIEDYPAFTNESALAFFENVSIGMDPDDAYCLAEEAITLDELNEGAVIEKTKIQFSKEFRELKKEVRAFGKATDAKEKAAHKKKANELLSELEKKAKAIPDDNFGSYAGRWTLGIIATAVAVGTVIGSAAKAGSAMAAAAMTAGSEAELIGAGAGAVKTVSTGIKVAKGIKIAGLVFRGTVIYDLIKAKIDGRSLKDVSKDKVLKSLAALKKKLNESPKTPKNESISAISNLRNIMLEDASYGSGESVEVENKTNDVVDGDKTKVKEPDFETTADAKKDLDKGEDEFDKVREGKEGSEANLGMKEGDHSEMETKNPITNEDITLDEDFDFDFNEAYSPIRNLRQMMNDEISLTEGGSY